MEIFTTIIIEFLLVVSSILFLFKLRDKLGLAPLYILLGAVQYVLALSGPMVSFNIYENITIYPASVILFSAVLFAVLLIYIKEGVVSARTLIIGIIISNFIISALFSIIYTQETISQNLAVQRPSVYAINYKYFITGTLILLLDFILLVIIYQFLILKKRNIHFFLIIFISLFSVLIFDATVFNFVLKYKSASFSESLIGHVIGKSVSSFIFSVILYLYLKFIEKETNHASFLANQYRDIFSILRYRKKIIDLQEEKKQVEQKLTSQLETSLNNISDGFVSLDTNWCYTYVNKKAGELLRRSPKSLIGKHIWTEFPEGVGRAFYKAYYKAVETQKTIYFEDYYKPFDRWFENRIYPSSDGLTIYFTDITDKKKADRNNQMLLSLIETSDDFVGLATLKGKPIYLNISGRNLVGLDANEELSGSIVDFFPNKYQDKIAKEHIPSIYENNKWNGEVEFQNFKTGDIIPIEMSIFLIRDNQTNKPLVLGIVATNIKKRKEAKEKLINSENHIRTILETGPECIKQLNAKGELIYMNSAGLAMIEADTLEMAKGNSLINLISPNHQNAFKKLTSNVFKGKSGQLEFEITGIKGAKRWLETHAVPFKDPDGNIISLLGVTRDITNAKLAEIELEKHRNNLEELVASRTSDLEKEKVKAQSADLMKSAFLATMSHELRTPMNSIIGFTGILLKEFAGPLNEEQKKQITMVKTSGEHLLKLINDVLDISKIEAGKLKVSKYPFNYVSILENTIEFLRPQVIKKDLKIKLECAETRIILNSDERRLEQVLLNLIANAIKFSEQGTIEVKVAVDDKFLITQVIDQGIGISNEEQNKLFTPFIQLENGLTRRHEGTGLGLAICKNIIEKLGGTIQVKSKKGEGSNFTFIIPIENNEN